MPCFVLVAKNLPFNKPNIPSFTISLGVTDYQESDDQSRMVKRADILLYEAKGAGRNRVMIG
ncbi:MAG: GGDEF domain-containing protein [Marinomonas sp.]